MGVSAGPYPWKQKGATSPPFAYCRTNQNGDGLEVRWIGGIWLGRLRPDQFTLANIHEFHRTGHALEGFLSIDTDY